MRVCNSFASRQTNQNVSLISRYTPRQIFEKDTSSSFNMLFVFFMQEGILISLTNMPYGNERRHTNHL